MPMTNSPESYNNSPHFRHMGECAQVHSASKQEALCSNAKFHAFTFQWLDDRQEVTPGQDCPQVPTP